MVGIHPWYPWERTICDTLDTLLASLMHPGREGREGGGRGEGRGGKEEGGREEGRTRERGGEDEGEKKVR